VTVKNGDLSADSYRILKRQEKHSQSLNVHSVSDVRQIEIHAVELIVPNPSHFEVELVLQT
jgi:uncharacterized HAD superfamily protein